MELRIGEIMRILPHRYPFLMVDRVVEVERAHRIVALKNVTINEPFFQGHFPGVPIMPGVLIIEAMAQVGGALVFEALEDKKSKLVFLMGIEGARFRKPVTPGDQIRIVMQALRLRARVGKLNGKAYVGDDLVAEADIMFSLVDRPESDQSP